MDYCDLCPLEYSLKRKYTMRHFCKINESIFEVVGQKIFSIQVNLFLI